MNDDINDVINAHTLVDALRAKGLDVDLYQSGGGVRTIGIGRIGEGDDWRYQVLVGPFDPDGSGWIGDCSYALDDNGMTESIDIRPGADVFVLANEIIEFIADRLGTRTSTRYVTQTRHRDDSDRAWAWSDRPGWHNTAEEAWSALDDTRKPSTREYRVVKRTTTDVVVERN